MNKKMVAVLVSAMMTMGLLTGCKSSDSQSGDAEYTIGISQFAEHGSLDNCREGFIEGLKEEGIEEGEISNRVQKRGGGSGNSQANQ